MGAKKPFAALMLLTLGFGIIVYPFLSNLAHTVKIASQAKSYNHQISRSNESGEADDRLEQIYQEMAAYNQALYESGQKDLSDPFSYEQASFDLTELGFEENIIGYLRIPKITLQEPVYLGASEQNMKNGVAHLTQTSLPVGGNNSNAVIAGHRGMVSKAMLRDIHKLEEGDLVQLTNFRETLSYRVVAVKIINPSDIHEVLIQPERDMLTLLSCNPLGYNYQRYVVYCERVQE